MDRHIVALQVQTVNEELRYAMEVMARDIKDSYVMASGTEPIILYLYHPTKNNTNNGVCTTSGFLGCLQYQYNSVDKRIEVMGKDDSNFVPLTSSNIEVEKLIFNIDATGGNASDQPKVTILIKAKEKKDSKGQSETSIQTTVNQKETINLYQGILNP